MPATTKYFNPIPLFLLFREAIEASIVVAVLLTFLSRSTPQLKSQVWWGVAAGVGLSLVLAAIFAILFYVAQNNVFQGQNLMIFKGCVSWVACVFITYLAFAMLRYQGWEAKWQRKLAAKGVKKIAEEDEKRAAALAVTAVEEGIRDPNTPAPAPLVTADLGSAPIVIPTAHKPVPQTQNVLQRWRHLCSKLFSDYALFFVTFFTVLREGMESIIFLFGIGNADPVSIPISGLIGIFCGCMAGVFIYYTGKTVKDIKWLLFFFAAVLFFIAAGCSELGAESLMYAGMFGTFKLPQTAYTAPNIGAVSALYYGVEGRPPAPSATGGAAASAFNDGDEIVMTGPLDLNDGYTYIMTERQPWYFAYLYDINKCCSDKDEKNRFLAVMKPIFGYNSQPTFIEAVFYMGYWLITLGIGIWKWYSGTLLDADWKHTRMMKALRKKEVEEALAVKLAEAQGSSDHSSGPQSNPAHEHTTNPLAIEAPRTEAAK